MLKLRMQERIRKHVEDVEKTAAILGYGVIKAPENPGLRAALIQELEDDDWHAHISLNDGHLLAFKAEVEMDKILEALCASEGQIDWRRHPSCPHAYMQKLRERLSENDLSYTESGVVLHISITKETLS